jgi:hypothetical protein
MNGLRRSTVSGIKSPIPIPGTADLNTIGKWDKHLSSGLAVERQMRLGN